MKNYILSVTFLFYLNVFSQAPVISYESPQSYSPGLAIEPLAPLNEGGSVPPTAYGYVTTIAGTGSELSADGPALEASFNKPTGVAVNAEGVLYIAEQYGHKIRKLEAGIVTTLAGQSGWGYQDGQGTAAGFQYPWNLEVGPAGDIFVADAGNHKVRKISASGLVSTYAGSGSSGSADGPALEATFRPITDVAFDGLGNLFIADSQDNKIRKVSPDGEVSTFAGSGVAGDADGVGTEAQFDHPYGLAADSQGFVYVADRGNLKIRKITPAGEVTTFAGSGFWGAADGPAESASFKSVSDVVIDAAGNIYVADGVGQKIRKISNGMVSTLAGTGSIGSGDGIGSQATFDYPQGIGIDASGNIYAAEVAGNLIRKISSVGWSVSPALPPGLEFDYTTGIITGTASGVMAPTEYTITACNGFGCSTSSLIVQVGQLSVSAADRKQIIIYPNAVRSILYLKLPGAEADSISCEIHDSTGKLVMRQRGVIDRIDVESLAAGTYIVKVTAPEGVMMEKFVKE